MRTQIINLMRIVYVIYVAVYSPALFSQCVNNVSTNPSNPTNNSLPINPVYPNGDLKTENGYTVDIVSNKEIFVEDDSTIDGEIVLRVEQMLPRTNVTYQANQMQVKKFCNSTTYQAYKSFEADTVVNESSRNVEFEQNSTDTNQDAELVISLYPNPAKDLFNIESNQPISEVIIRDLFGREVKYFVNRTNQNSTHFVIQVEATNGVYWLTITAGEKTTVKQIVINK